MTDAVKMNEKTLPPVPLRRKKCRSFDTVAQQRAACDIRNNYHHNDNSIRDCFNFSNRSTSEQIKTQKMNNESVIKIFDKNSIVFATCSTSKLSVKSQMTSMSHEVDKTINIIGDTVKRKKKDPTIDKILSHNSACGILDRKTEIIDDQMGDNNIKYVESTLKVIDNQEIRESSAKSNQAQSGRKFMCAINNSKDSNRSSYENNSNSQNSYDCDKNIDRGRKSNNNNDNNIFEVAFCVNSDQECCNDIPFKLTHNDEIKKNIELVGLDTNPIINSKNKDHTSSIENKVNKICLKNIRNNSNNIGISKRYVYPPCEKREYTVIFQSSGTLDKLNINSKILSNIDTSSITLSSEFKSSTSSIETLKQFNGYDCEKKFIKFGNDNTMNKIIRRKLKRKAPPIPKSKSVDNRDKIEIDKNTNLYQVFQSQSMDESNVRKQGSTIQFASIFISHDRKSILFSYGPV